MARIIESLGRGFRFRRSFTSVGADLVKMQQRYEVSTRYDGHLVTGPHWLASSVHVVSGEANFRLAGEVVVPPPAFALFLPPFAVVHFQWNRCVVETAGMLCRARLENAPAWPCIATPVRVGDLDSPEALDGMLARARKVPLGVERPEDALAPRAKALLDHCDPLRYRTLRSVARELEVAPETLSRVFKQAYGLQPLEYWRRVQLMSAIMKLAGGASILNAALDAGFNDLATFYRRFRSLARVRPSSYQSFIERRPGPERPR